MSAHSLKKDVKETKKEIRKRKKITKDDVLYEQHQALLAKQEKLKLKKRKLELEIYLMEQRATREGLQEQTGPVSHDVIAINQDCFDSDERALH